MLAGASGASWPVIRLLRKTFGGLPFAIGHEDEAGPVTQQNRIGLAGEIGGEPRFSSSDQVERPHVRGPEALPVSFEHDAAAVGGDPNALVVPGRPNLLDARALAIAPDET